MKAIILKAPGGTENLVPVEIVVPEIRENEVLIKVTSLSINPVDIKTRTGKGVYGRIKEESPLILGWDVSGEVVATGNEVTEFKKGDQVFGMVNFPGHGKVYAEYVAAPATHLTHKPESLSHQEAAAATLAALTAWQVLKHEAKVGRGQKVLMHAAAGGVGHFAVQMVKHLGGSVIGTASAANAAFLKELGADGAIDYKSESFETVVQDADMVFDPLGGETTLKSLKALKNGGRLISIVGGVTEEVKELAKQRNIEASNYLVQSSGSDMKDLAVLLKEQKLKAHVSHQFAFEQMADAHKQIETGRTRGKIVVNMA